MLNYKISKLLMFSMNCFPEKSNKHLSDLPSLCHNMVICLKKTFVAWKRWLCFCSKHKGSFHIFVCITHLKVNKIFQRRVLNHVYHAANISWCLTSHDCALPSTIILYLLKEFQNIFESSLSVIWFRASKQDI